MHRISRWRERGLRALSRAAAPFLRLLLAGLPCKRLRHRLWHWAERHINWRGAELTGRTRFGARMRTRLDDLVEHAIYYFGCWEPNLTAVIAERLRPGMLFVDAGANVGYFSLLAAHLGADVVAIEAAPHTARRLRDNLARNPRLASRIRVVEAALAPEPGSLDLFLAPAANRGATTTSAVRARQAGYAKAVRVPARRLTDILSADERARLAFLKLDIEGADIPVLVHLMTEAPDLLRRITTAAEISRDGLAAAGLTLAAFQERLAALGLEMKVLINRYDFADLLARQPPQPPQPFRSWPEDKQQIDVLITPRC